MFGFLPRKIDCSMLTDGRAWTTKDNMFQKSRFVNGFKGKIMKIIILFSVKSYNLPFCKVPQMFNSCRFNLCVNTQPVCNTKKCPSHDCSISLLHSWIESLSVQLAQAMRFPHQEEKLTSCEGHCFPNLSIQIIFW